MPGRLLLAMAGDLGDRHGQAGASINLGELLSLSLAYREARGPAAMRGIGNLGVHPLRRAQNGSFWRNVVTRPGVVCCVASVL